jgi:hypothetical protein
MGLLIVGYCIASGKHGYVTLEVDRETYTLLDIYNALYKHNITEDPSNVTLNITFVTF